MRGDRLICNLSEVLYQHVYKHQVLGSAADVFVTGHVWVHVQRVLQDTVDARVWTPIRDRILNRIMDPELRRGVRHVRPTRTILGGL